MSGVLVDEHDLLVLDLDGVVYVGAEAVPGAVETLTAVHEAGTALRYATNNASRTPAQVAGHLRSLGVPAETDQVVTSSQAAARLVADTLGDAGPVLAVGGPGVADALTAAGLDVVSSADDRPVAVVQGYGPDVGWRQLTEAALAVRAGARWVATNVDPTLPTERGPAPGNGALVAAVRTATGAEPLVAGKPQPTLFQVAARGARSPLVVGDRLDTDVAAARAAGMRSLLVLTGVTRPEELLAAGPLERPDLVGADLRCLLEPPRVVPRAPEGGWWVSGTAQVRLHDGRLQVRAGDDDVQMLCAAAAAVWDARDDGRGPDLTEVADQLRDVVTTRR